MKRLWLAAAGCLLLAAAACGGSVSNPSPDQTPVPSSDAADVSRFFAIEEVGLGPNGYVTLLNYTDQPASIDTMYLCQAAGCVDLPDVVVAPGEVARIAVGDGAGLEKVAMTGARLDLPPSDGEVAVFASADVRDPKDVRAYLQWGLTPHELTKVAVEAGLWREEGYAPSGPNATRLWKTDANLWVWDSE